MVVLTTHAIGAYLGAHVWVSGGPSDDRVPDVTDVTDVRKRALFIKQSLFKVGDSIS